MINLLTLKSLVEDRLQRDSDNGRHLTPDLSVDLRQCEDKLLEHSSIINHSRSLQIERKHFTLIADFNSLDNLAELGPAYVMADQFGKVVNVI